VGCIDEMETDDFSVPGICDDIWPVAGCG
jgi:hypothetical protein